MILNDKFSLELFVRWRMLEDAANGVIKLSERKRNSIVGFKTIKDAS